MACATFAGMNLSSAPGFRSPSLGIPARSRRRLQPNYNSTASLPVRDSKEMHHHNNRSLTLAVRKERYRTATVRESVPSPIFSQILTVAVQLARRAAIGSIRDTPRDG